CTGNVRDVQVDLDALAALNYTGGTTGMPKGCMHTQRDMLYTAAASLAVSSEHAPLAAAQPSADVMLNFLPMFWIAGENLGLIYP
ncbi:AMP-binding protein, partial [Mycobacterium tuberculosis]|nr:AMP-binding protein [Mycobacterium tuberculosis]